MYKMFKKVALLSVLFASIGLLASSSVSAHVVVRPGEAQPSKYTTFSVGVPNERDVDTISVKLEIPEGVTAVTPNVKPGWEIETETDSVDDNDHGGGQTVKSITWLGGSIPVNQRDDFIFSAKAPDQEGELVWKAYQTYADGVTVSWDRTEDDQPKKEDGSPDFFEFGPYSVTVLQSADSETDEGQQSSIVIDSSADDASANRALYVSIAAVVVAFISLIIATRPKK